MIRMIIAASGKMRPAIVFARKFAVLLPGRHSRANRNAQFACNPAGARADRSPCAGWSLPPSSGGPS